MQLYYILIVGAFSTGKTQFVQATTEIDVIPVEYDRREEDESNLPYPGFHPDFGRVTINEDIYLCYFANPGAWRFDVRIVPLLAKGLLGIISLVDSSKPESWGESRKIFEAVYFNYHFPLIVAANKQDHPDAWPVEDLRIALKVPAHIPMVPCVARDKESVKRVLLRLLEEVLARCED